MLLNNTHLQKFLASNNLSFEIAGIERATPPQEFDRCIMDIVTSNDSFEDRDIKYVYYCKSFEFPTCVMLMVLTFYQNIKDGYRSIQQSQSKYEKIIQGRPYDVR